MWQDVGDLKHFYDREIGHTARHLLRLRIRSLWPDLTGQRLLGIGYATPTCASSWARRSGSAPSCRRRRG